MDRKELEEAIEKTASLLLAWREQDMRACDNHYDFANFLPEIDRSEGTLMSVIDEGHALDREIHFLEEFLQQHQTNAIKIDTTIENNQCLRRGLESETLTIIRTEEEALKTVLQNIYQAPALFSNENLTRCITDLSEEILLKEKEVESLAKSIRDLEHILDGRDQEPSLPYMRNRLRVMDSEIDALKEEIGAKENEISQLDKELEEMADESSRFYNNEDCV